MGYEGYSNGPTDAQAKTVPIPKVGTVFKQGSLDSLTGMVLRRVARIADDHIYYTVFTLEYSKFSKSFQLEITGGAEAISSYQWVQYGKPEQPTMTKVEFTKMIEHFRYLANESLNKVLELTT
jgi:hypothetical protein